MPGVPWAHEKLITAKPKIFMLVNEITRKTKSSYIISMSEVSLDVLNNLINILWERNIDHISDDLFKYD